MPKSKGIGFREEVSGLANSAEKAVAEAGEKIKAKVLEEISSFSPFPKVEVGHEVPGNNFVWDGKRRKIDGIMVLTARQSGLAPHLGNYVILQPDGLYLWRIFFNDKAGLPNADYFKYEGISGGKAADLNLYVIYQKAIVDAVEGARGRLLH